MMSVGIGLLRLAIVLLVIAAIWRVGQTAYDFAYHVVSDAAVDPEPGCESFRDFGYGQQGDRKAVGEPWSDHGQQNIPDSVEADRLR